MCRFCVDTTFWLLWVNNKECDHWIIWLVLWETTKLSSGMTISFHIPARKDWISVTMFLSAVGVVSILDFSPSNRCMVISYCFSLHFPDDLDMEHLFIYLFAICYVLWDNLFYPIFKIKLFIFLLCYYFHAFLFSCLPLTVNVRDIVS